MNKQNDGGPAFPVSNDANVNDQEGMTLRDYFAAKAMQALLSACDADGTWTGNDPVTASQAYKMADAMLKAREVPNEQA